MLSSNYKVDIAESTCSTSCQPCQKPILHHIGLRTYHDFVFIFLLRQHCVLLFFFFNDPATPEIYPLPLPDPFPISRGPRREASAKREANGVWAWTGAAHHKLVGSTARQPPLEMCFRAVSIRGGRLAQAHGIE